MAIALVTGTSSGIGLATAVTLARAGHQVIATMRNLDGAGELQKIVSAEKLPVTVAALNVDDDASVENAISKAIAENGRIDVLVYERSSTGQLATPLSGRAGRGAVPHVASEQDR